MGKGIQEKNCRLKLDFSEAQLLSWSLDWPYVAMLHSCSIQDSSGAYDWLIGVGEEAYIDEEADLTSFDHWIENSNGEFRFGVLSYDLRLQFEKLPDVNASAFKMPDIAFFKASVVIASKNGQIQLLKGPKSVLDDLVHFLPMSPKKQAWKFEDGMPKEEYSASFKEVKRLLQQGELYEMNLCRPFLASFSDWNSGDAESLFLQMLKKNPAVQSGFLRIDDKVILSSSPERYLLKNGRRLVSEPIKGTIARHSDPKQDALHAEQLKNSRKERSENVMIVDLVRNDLSRLSIPGSVEVKELFSIRRLPHVYQMVSVVHSQMERDYSFSEILRASFPMGSMTGAPKVAAMREADRLENFKRAWYSGSLGYIDPDENFDFNVLIRSVIIDAESHQALLGAGGAITIESNEEDEFQETEVKARSTIHSLGANVRSATYSTNKEA